MLLCAWEDSRRGCSVRGDQMGMMMGWVEEDGDDGGSGG